MSGPPIARSIGHINTNNNLNVNVPTVTPPSYMAAGFPVSPVFPTVPNTAPISHSMGHIPSSSNNGPLPTTPQVLPDDLVPGEAYHVWTRIGDDFKHEGHGKFVRLQGGGFDALFMPFQVINGPQHESQVFDIVGTHFYRLSNIKGGKRKSRRGRKKTRKSRRHSRK